MNVCWNWYHFTLISSSIVSLCYISDCSVMLYCHVSALMRNGKGEGKAAIGSGQSGIVEESAKCESHFHYCMSHIA